MKFTCENCSAQYMISDSKVGPNGVKVRCKKCGNVVLVRRSSELGAEAPDAGGPVADAPESDVTAGAAGADGSGSGASDQDVSGQDASGALGEGEAGEAGDHGPIAEQSEAQAPQSSDSPGPARSGLDAELGQAFDTAFGDSPEAGGQSGAGSESSQVASGTNGSAAQSPAPTEWYVAIGQAQVGPLPLAEVRRKWEAGDVGPDSLVWRPGMGDWKPLSSVGELADFLAPVSRPKARAESSSQQRRATPAATPAATPVPAADVSWKPVGASALAALASEEIAGRAAAEAKQAAPRAPAAPSRVKSLVDGLPDGDGVDPTGSLPLSIKGLDSSGPARAERRSSVASMAEETRHKRSMTRAIVVAAILVIAVVGGAAAYVLSQMKKLAAPGSVPQTAVAVSTTTASTTAAQSPPAAQAAQTTPAAPAAPAEAKTASAAPAAQATPAAPAAPASQAASAVASRPANDAQAAGAKQEATRAGRKEPTRREAQSSRAGTVAQVEAAPPPPPPPPVRAAKKDSLLDFDSSDSALDDALGGKKSSGRSVYVPPARGGGGGAVADKLSPSQINESVASRIDSLRKCVSEQKARDPGASGVLKVSWVIGGDGSVRDVRSLTGEYSTGPFAQCITGVVKSIRFPRSGTSGQPVTFPFSF